jgi:hypothetical protein
MTGGLKVANNPLRKHHLGLAGHPTPILINQNNKAAYAPFSVVKNGV